MIVVNVVRSYESLIQILTGVTQFGVSIKNLTCVGSSLRVPAGRGSTQSPSEDAPYTGLAIVA